jgi:hypothetical protein
VITGRGRKNDGKNCGRRTKVGDNIDLTECYTLHKPSAG